VSWYHLKNKQFDQCDDTNALQSENKKFLKFRTEAACLTKTVGRRLI
jgi:hypothetical protein